MGRKVGEREGWREGESGGVVNDCMGGMKGSSE